MTDPARSDVALLYRRAGFGLRPDELDAKTGLGFEAAVDELIDGLGSVPDPPGDAVAVPSFTPYARPTDPTSRKAFARQEATELKALQDWWVKRMIVTATPLREKLTLFWHGHFATGASKVRDARLMYLQNQLFRTAGGGSFEVLTQAVAKDGAMMVWLDTATDKKAHPNENFAREMMELFTLGIGNYTQDDVTAAARAFTGWAYDRVDDRYVFRPRQHDDGSKTFLAHTGDFNGTDVITIDVHEPASARFVLAKLWSHFAYPVTPTDPVVSDLLPAYGSSLNISSALRGVLLHPAFRSDASRGGLVKQPIEYVVGAARALGASGQRVRLAALSTLLGQAPFNPPNVGGWGQNSYWLDTATTELRLRAALALAIDADLSAIAGTATAGRVDAVAEMLGLDGWGPTSRAALARVADHPVGLVGLALTAPEYVLA
jgi:uncharacterized protein (DUF1800 family)